MTRAVLAFAFPCAVRRPSKGDLAGITLVGLSLEIARGQQLIGGLVLLVLSATFEHRVPVRFDTAGIAALLYLALVASAGAHTVAVWLAGATSATFAASWTYVSPFVALLAGALWLHEPVGPSAWIGGVLVVCGCVALTPISFERCGAARPLFPRSREDPQSSLAGDDDHSTPS